MPTLSAFKDSFLSALKNPHEVHRPRPRRRVISFNEALENLKTSQTGFITCAAFHSFGRCHKQITLTDSNFTANLDQLDVTDVQTPIKLMPLMLCSSHWEKTVYHNALFLDWLSVYGTKQDHPHYENIVVDYQSAITIDNEEQSMSKNDNSSGPMPGGQGRPVSAPNNLTKDSTYLTSLNPLVHLQIPHPDDEPGPPEPELDHAASNLPEISVLVGMESYASIEFGVAKLEIMYQENLKCIAMTSTGWRCPAIIQGEQMLKARELLKSSVTTEGDLDMELLSRLVLCPGHALGDLSQIYSERWAAFAEQRLPKEEAMSKFDAEFWVSVEFFHSDWRDDTGAQMVMRRPKSASNLTSRLGEKRPLELINNTRGEGNSVSPPINKLPNFPGKFEFSLSHHSPRLESIPPTFGPEDRLERLSLSAEVLTTRSADLATLIGTSLGVEAPASALSPAIEPLGTSNNLRAEASTASDLKFSNYSNTPFGGVSNSRLTDKSPLAGVPEPVLKKVIPSGQELGAQAPKAQKSAIPSFSEEEVQPSIKTYSQDIIDSSLVKQMKLPIPVSGKVYIFKSPDKKLVKIGYASNINLRKEQQQIGCQLQYYDQVEVDSMHCKHPVRVARLVHLELHNFRANLGCQGHHQKVGKYNDLIEREHGQWFDVDEGVAIQSVRLWRDFVDQVYTSEGTIKENWAKRMTLLPKPSGAETFYLESRLGGSGGNDSAYHHWWRNHRYTTWFNEGKLEGSTLSP